MFSFLLFLFKSCGKKEDLDENYFRHSNGKYLSESYLISAFFKVLFQKLRVMLTMAFERYFTVEDFTDMDHYTN